MPPPSPDCIPFTPCWCEMHPNACENHPPALVLDNGYLELIIVIVILAVVWSITIKRKDTPQTYFMIQHKKEKPDTGKTYEEYKSSIKIGGTTTMSDAKRKKARAKRKLKNKS